MPLRTVIGLIAFTLLVSAADLVLDHAEHRARSALVAAVALAEEVAEH